MPDEQPAVPRLRSYQHVLKALEERPWALQPQVLRFMAELTQFRAAGGHLSAADIDERLAAAAAENGDRGGGATVGGVAVLPLYGLISQRTSMMSDFSGGTSVDAVRSDLRAALADPQVSAVVFDIDSPGGSVDGIPELAADLRKARGGSKPIVGQVNTLAASAAYWLASCMNEIVVTPSGAVGSIGVFATHEDISGEQEQMGIKTTLISAGPYKTEGNPYVPLGDDARAAMQEQVDTFYSMFLNDVAKGRKTTVDSVAAGYGQGRVVLAQAALDAGMVDGIATLQETVDRLQPRAAKAKPAAQVVPIKRATAPGKPDPAWNDRVAALMR